MITDLFNVLLELKQSVNRKAAFKIKYRKSMKRYVVYIGDKYHTRQGSGDICGSFNDLTEAIEYASDKVIKRQSPQDSYVEIYDNETELPVLVHEFPNAMTGDEEPGYWYYGNRMKPIEEYIKFKIKKK